MPTPQERAEAKAARSRETYTLVRTRDYKLFTDICAFASTLDYDRDDVSARIEAFCMSVARRAWGET